MKLEIDTSLLFRGIDPCSDHNCVFREHASTGMGTNGGCNCYRKEVRMSLLAQRLHDMIQREPEYED